MWVLQHGSTPTVLLLFYGSRHIHHISTTIYWLYIIMYIHIYVYSAKWLVVDIFAPNHPAISGAESSDKHQEGPLDASPLVASFKPPNKPFFLPVLTFFGLGNSMKPYETIISVNKPNLCLICWNIICWWFRHDIVTTIVTKGCLDLRDPGGLSNLRLGLLLLVPAKICEICGARTHGDFEGDIQREYTLW